LLRFGGAPAGAGRSLFEKSSAKTFLLGPASLCVIFGGEALLLLQSEAHRGKRKLAFFCPYVSRTEGILFAREKNTPKMTLIALARGGGGGERRILIALAGTANPSRKVFAELFPKSDRPAPAGAPKNSYV